MAYDLGAWVLGAWALAYALKGLWAGGRACRGAGVILVVLYLGAGALALVTSR